MVRWNTFGGQDAGTNSVIVNTVQHDFTPFCTFTQHFSYLLSFEARVSAWFVCGGVVASSTWTHRRGELLICFSLALLMIRGQLTLRVGRSLHWLAGAVFVGNCDTLVTDSMVAWRRRSTSLLLWPCTPRESRVLCMWRYLHTVHVTSLCWLSTRRAMSYVLHIPRVTRFRHEGVVWFHLRQHVVMCI